MKTEERIELLKTYLLDDPADFFSKYVLALEYIKANKDEIAEPLMQELNSMHSEYLPNYYHYGKVLERKGDFERAAGIYSQGIVLARKSGDSHTMNELNGALENLE